MTYQPIVAPPEQVRPDYMVYDYTNGIFKIVRHKGNHFTYVPYSDRQKKGNEQKLDPALSRARRVVLELALCNDWTYFATFTLSKDKFDRSDLKKWVEKFTLWLRYQRKKYPNLDIRYVLVPEKHKDGSWHMHGLLSDISPVLVSFRDLWDSGVNVPWKLVKNGYYNWPDCQDKFGFCSFGEIRNKVATGFYVTKYLSKQLSESCVPVGMKLYYPSQNLNHAEKHGDGIYGHCGYLDTFLTNHYEFCDTGMTHVKDGLGWDFALEYMNVEPLEIQTPPDTEDILAVDTYYETVQEVLEGF